MTSHKHKKDYICICPKCHSIIKSENEIHYCLSDPRGKNMFDFMADIPPAVKHEYVGIWGYLKGIFSRSDRFEHRQSCDNIPEFLLNPKVDTYRICLVGMRNSGKTCFKLMLKELLGAQHIKSDMGYDNARISENAPLPENASETDDIVPEYLKFNYKGKNKVFVVYDVPGSRFEGLSKTNNVKWLECIKNTDFIFVFLEAKQLLKGYSESDTENLCQILYKMFSAWVPNKICYVYSKCDEISEEDKSEFKEYLEKNHGELHQKIYVDEENKEIKRVFVSILGQNCKISENSDMNKILLKKYLPIGISDISDIIDDWMKKKN